MLPTGKDMSGSGFPTATSTPTALKRNDVTRIPNRPIVATISHNSTNFLYIQVQSFG